MLLLGIGSTSFAFAPSFRDASTTTANGSNSITFPKPLSMANDVLIAAITIRNPSSSFAITTVPADWVAIRNDSAPGVIAQFLYYKIATGSEPSDYTFGFSETRDSAGAVASFWEVDTSTPIDAHNGRYNATDPPVAPSITTTVSDTLLVAIFGIQSGNDISKPDNMTERWEQEGNVASQGFDETFTGPGTTGDRVSSTNRDDTIGQLIALRPATTVAPGAAGTVLFITRNSDETLTAFEQLRADYITSWGYSIITIAEDADQTIYDSRIPQADVIYLPADVQSNTHGTRTRNACVGVLDEERNLYDEFGISSSASNADETDIRIIDNSNYITEPFLFGDYPLFSSGQRLNYLDGTVAPDALILGTQPAAGTVGNLTVVDTGGILYDGGTAIARRVQLPWGNSSTDFTEVTGSGLQIMKRSLEWASESNTCLNLQKRAFLADGTPLANGNTLAKGTEVHFLIYINNSGDDATDVSLQDTLDPGFAYLSPSLQTASMTKCAAPTCTASEEQTIYDTVIATAVKTDNADLLDEVSYSSGDTTIYAGDQVVGNQQLDIPGGSLWALLFSVRVQ